MIHIILNGSPMTLIGEVSLEEFLKSSNTSNKGVAISLNRSIVPKSKWSSTLVRNNDMIELVSAAPGG